MSATAGTNREPTGIDCDGCGVEQHVGDEGWEGSEGLDWCPVCWVEYAPDDEVILVPMTRLQAKAAVLCIDTVVEHDTGLTPSSMPEAGEVIQRALAYRPPARTDVDRATRRPGIECEDCLIILDAEYPGESIFSPFWLETDIHSRHQPMHPNEVGANHRRRARKEWDAWEAASPLNHIRPRPAEAPRRSGEPAN